MDTFVSNALLFPLPNFCLKCIAISSVSSREEEKDCFFIRVRSSRCLVNHIMLMQPVSMQPTGQHDRVLCVPVPAKLLFRFHKLNASLVFPLLGLLASAALVAKIKPERLFFLRQTSATVMITIETPTSKELFGKRPKHTNIAQNCKKADTTCVCRMSQAEEKILNYLLIQGLE